MSFEKVLIIIPARGGSKGIPRKNLKLVNGKPLIYYSITSSLQSKYKPDVYVSSEDEEILTISKKLGANTFKRDPSTAQDVTTLDPVIYETYQHLRKKKEYDLVITIQPTSPLLKTISLDLAIDKILQNKQIDSILSASEDTHLTWRIENDEFTPNYKERLNRQYLPKVFKETGSFLITRPQFVRRESRLGKNVDLHILTGPEKIDIDTYEDISICEYYLKKKRILYTVIGNKTVGTGHVFNALSVADGIFSHELIFLIKKEHHIAYKLIQAKNHAVFIQEEDDIIDDVKRLNPDIVINDILDTDEAYMLELKNICEKVINIEDLGPGAKFSDVLINAMYPLAKIEHKSHYMGASFFFLKPDFEFMNEVKLIKPEVGSVLLSFGGTDPNNLTLKTYNAIIEYCLQSNIKINVVLGTGYEYDKSCFENASSLHQNIANLADLVLDSDIVFTSGGRTTFEIASIGVPTIVLCQNERELLHAFANETNGFINLGLGEKLTQKNIFDSFLSLVKSKEERIKMNQKMLTNDIRSGRKRVLELIKREIESV